MAQKKDPKVTAALALYRHAVRMYDIYGSWDYRDRMRQARQALQDAVEAVYVSRVPCEHHKEAA